jgi:AP2 domain
LFSNIMVPETDVHARPFPAFRESQTSSSALREPLQYPVSSGFREADPALMLHLQTVAAAQRRFAALPATTSCGYSARHSYSDSSSFSCEDSSTASESESEEEADAPEYSCRSRSSSFANGRSEWEHLLTAIDLAFDQEESTAGQKRDSEDDTPSDYSYTKRARTTAARPSALRRSYALPQSDVDTSDSECEEAAMAAAAAKKKRAQQKSSSSGSSSSSRHVLPSGVPGHALARRGPRGQSRFKGVCITRAGKWRAVIYIGRKQKYLGVYDTEEEAAHAYDASSIIHFGPEAKRNFMQKSPTGASAAAAAAATAAASAVVPPPAFSKCSATPFQFGSHSSSSSSSARSGKSLCV